ncbi:MAG: hypothetical protein ACE5D7_05170 [Fidelibacterota bacterium]
MNGTHWGMMGEFWFAVILALIALFFTVIYCSNHKSHLTPPGERQASEIPHSRKKPNDQS